MKIYDWGIAPNPRRVRIFLAEKGIDIPLEDIGDGMVLKQSYRDNHPQAMAPLLELDDGSVIGEVMGICRYLEANRPNPPLLGTDPKSIGLIACWENRANEEGMLAASECFRNTHPDFADRGLPGSAEPIPQLPALVERAKGRLRRFYKKIDGEFAKKQFLAGDTYSVADITALCAVDFAGWVELGADSEIAADCPNMKRWYGEVSSRPGSVA